MKKILTFWLRLQFKLIDRCGYCVDVNDGYTKIIAAEAKDVLVVGVFD